MRHGVNNVNNMPLLFVYCIKKCIGKIVKNNEKLKIIKCMLTKTFNKCKIFINKNGVTYRKK